ncbi:hypothetical protein B0T25DRAFT_547372 [Lasiosphaeria hispida]|uniref:Uncharacterized protein n=1 Tax=Lasiosphaeria hispida TaxID=260671 RepID=A0AAJ0MCG3_9PEZI|nr:hypothetical protein B0T25DRAFT_547372 [Lasiosphaeria hispida]
MEPESETERPHRPHNYEYAFFYLGVAGNLVARTSTYRYPTSHFPYQDFKRFWTIGDHPILSIWSEELVQEIELALDNLEWDRFYPIRIGSLYPGFNEPCGPERALVLMVDIPTATTNWDTAIEVALQCRNILRQAGIPDIEVEVREVDRQCLAMDLELEELVETSDYSGSTEITMEFHPEFSYTNLALVLSNIGYQIAPEKEVPTYYGTMGLHVRLSGRPSEVYGLTCRHVAHRPAKDGSSGVAQGSWLPNADRWRLEDGEKGTRHRMVQLCPSELNGIQVAMTRKLGKARQYQQSLSIKKMKSEFDPDSQTKMSRVEDHKLATLEMGIPFAEAVLKLITKDTLETVEGRAIGHIAAMPPFEVSTRGFFRDWALIRLDEAKFGGPITNQVHVGWQDSCPGPPELPELRDKCDANSKIRIQGTISSGDIHGRRSIQVAKRGARTGLTCGMTNEIKAVIRTPTSDGKRLRAWEWIVVGCASTSGGIANFSQEGDSGAAVFDYHGRVVGFLGSGFSHGKITKKGEKTAAAEVVPRLWKHHSLDDEELPQDPGKANDPKIEDAPPEGFRAYSAGTDLSFVTPVDIVFGDIQLETGCNVEVI